MVLDLEISTDVPGMVFCNAEGGFIVTGVVADEKPGILQERESLTLLTQMLLVDLSR